MPQPSFLALDFETANRDADSACQLGVVRVEDGRIAGEASWMIRPPSDLFVFTELHGIAWEDVADAPTLKELWGEVAPWLEGADYLAAHNAPFDRGVLEATCRLHGLNAPRKPYVDTVSVARQVWNIFPTKLNLVCQRLQIPLNHHEALSDARACAQILIQAQAQGWAPAKPPQPA